MCFINKEDLISLQLWITLVIMLGLIETAMLLMHYVYWNGHGSPSLIIGALATFLGVFKRAISRILILIVSLGYGVVKPNLGDEMNKVLLLGGSYFCLSLLYQSNALIPGEPTRTSIPEPQANLNILVVLLLASVDSVFYVWTFSALNNIITSLSVRSQSAKLSLYINFRNILYISLLLIFSWASYTFIILFVSHVDRNWDKRWTIDALWEINYFIIFVTIAYFWAPSKNNQRYAYSTELSQNEDILELTDLNNQIEIEEQLKDNDDPFQVNLLIFSYYIILYLIILLLLFIKATGALDYAMAVTKKE